MYICIDTNDYCAKGDTLNNAFENYNKNIGEDAFESLAFYKAEKVEVEIVEKPIVIKQPIEKKVSK